MSYAPSQTKFLQDRPVRVSRTCDNSIGGSRVSDEMSDIVTENSLPFRGSQE